MSARIVSVVNVEGGTGTTTIGLCLATALAINKKLKILYLDCDPRAPAYQHYQCKKRFYGRTIKSSFEIQKLKLAEFFSKIEELKLNYDLIFIDAKSSGELRFRVKALIMLCDCILVPIIPNNVDWLIMFDFFVDLIQMKNQKENENSSFMYAAFLNRVTRCIANNERTREQLERFQVPTLRNGLKEVPLIKDYTIYKSLLSGDETECELFEPFFNEVVAFFDL